MTEERTAGRRKGKSRSLLSPQSAGSRTRFVVDLPRSWGPGGGNTAKSLLKNSV